MPPLVLALALTAVAPFPPPPQVAPLTLGSAFMPPTPVCRDIDPSFVIDVAPPAGRGPLWAIERRAQPNTVQTDATQKLVAKRLNARPGDACPRLLNAAGAR